MEESTITYYIYRSQKAWAVSYDAQNSTCGTTGEQTKQNTWFLLGRNSLLGKMEHICIGCNVRTFLSKDLILQMETLSYDELKTEKRKVSFSRMLVHCQTKYWQLLLQSADSV